MNWFEERELRRRELEEQCLREFNETNDTKWLSKLIQFGIERDKDEKIKKEGRRKK